MAPSIPAAQPLHQRLDALLLAILVTARLRIDTLAEAAVLPQRQADVARHPWLGHLLPPRAMELLAQQQLVDPVGLLLIVAATGCLLGYLLVAEFVTAERLRYRLKLALLAAIIGLTVLAPSIKLMLLRQANGPASYSHDGGVIQTEAAEAFVLEGINPYGADYTGTPMAEWGIGEFRTALYHYPYLPWTFLFSLPLRLLAQATLGWFDQRLVYLLLFVLTLALLPAFGRDRTARLLLVMGVGLNPIMGSDLIYGQNDSFVLAWLVLSLWLWLRGQQTSGGAGWGWTAASAAAVGLAFASKPTAWFFAPFYLLLVTRAATADLRRRLSWLRSAWRAAWPAVAAAGLVLAPYLLGDFGALWDDVWRWSGGTSATAYQIWGWGASNLVLALGWVSSRFAYWPFWLPELLVGLPLMAALLWRQLHHNNLGQAVWGYGLFLFAYAFFSRFLNENYLGYIVALLVVGGLAGPAAIASAGASTPPAAVPPSAPGTEAVGSSAT